MGSIKGMPKMVNDDGVPTNRLGKKSWMPNSASTFKTSLTVVYFGVHDRSSHHELAVLVPQIHLASNTAVRAC